MYFDNYKMPSLDNYTCPEIVFRYCLLTNKDRLASCKPVCNNVSGYGPLKDLSVHLGYF